MKVRKMFFLFLVVFIVACSVTSHGMTDKQFKTTRAARKYIVKKFSNYGKVEFIDFSKLKDSDLRNRKAKGKIIVDVTRGICLNNNHDGLVLNPRKGYGRSICYSGIKCRKGSRITTFCVYEIGNGTNADGIWKRYDVVTKK